MGAGLEGHHPFGRGQGQDLHFLNFIQELVSKFIFMVFCKLVSNMLAENHKPLSFYNFCCTTFINPKEFFGSPSAW